MTTDQAGLVRVCQLPANLASRAAGIVTAALASAKVQEGRIRAWSFDRAVPTYDLGLEGWS